MTEKPDCHNCYHKYHVLGFARIGCANPEAKIKGSARATSEGWFSWPSNFDPVWLLECNGFKKQQR
ncbi:MAG: hypothetical protein GY928_20725 [Colwellia sp.]|nr:hypothetical protein [Colwellia sp.]